MKKSLLRKNEFVILYLPNKYIREAWPGKQGEPGLARARPDEPGEPCRAWAAPSLGRARAVTVMFCLACDPGYLL